MEPKQLELADIITKSPTITRDKTIREFIDLMTKNKISLVPVVENNLVIGVVSEKDLMRLVKAQPIAGIQAIMIREIPHDVSKRIVADIMTSHPITIRETASVNDALKIMAANNLKRVIVIDQNKKLLGLVHAKDIFRKLSEIK